MVVAAPFDALRARVWQTLDHLQPRSHGFEQALDAATADLRARRHDGRLSSADPMAGQILTITETLTTGPRLTGGIILAVKVDAAGPDAVLPHERTFEEPVARRVRTRRALGAESVPSLLLLRDAVPALTALLKLASDPGQDAVRLTTGRVDCLATPVAAAALPEVVQALRGVPALIADGHHRVSAANAPSAMGRGTTLAWLVAADQAPRLLPVHRTLPHLPSDAMLRLHGAGIEASPTTPACHPEHPVLVTSEGAFTLKAAPGGRAAAVLAALHPAVAALPVSLGHHTLHDVLGLGVRRASVRTTTSSNSALASVGAGDSAGALLACGPTLAEVWRAAEHGVLMPPKATWFAPKPPSGSVVRLLSHEPSSPE